ncbi:MAG: hypothetical protein IJ727_01730 [Treponema sp.]|nr:hypothetical protein [Treponema sp.]
MSFYNLIPAGKNCNSLKLEEKLGMSPYEEKIEDMTFLFPDIPLGLSLDCINPRDCLVKFHPKKGMRKNVETLALEERYVRHAAEAHRLLSNLQKLSDEKIEELEKMGFGRREEIISSNFGPQQPEEKKKSLRQKMLKDLTGY